MNIPDPRTNPECYIHVRGVSLAAMEGHAESLDVTIVAQGILHYMNLVPHALIQQYGIENLDDTAVFGIPALITSLAVRAGFDPDDLQRSVSQAEALLDAELNQNRPN